MYTLNGDQTISSRLANNTRCTFEIFASRYARRPLLQLFSATLGRENQAIAKNLFSSIAHVPRRLFFQVSLSIAGPIYRNSTATAVADRTFYYHSHSVDGKSDHRICERIPLRRHKTWDFFPILTFSLSLSFSFFVFLYTQLHLSY